MMKIIICGSMTFSCEMIKVKNELEKYGHSVILPKFTEEYAQLKTIDEMHSESAKNKIEHDLIRKYFNEIDKGNAVLIVNEARKGIENYIGGNSFLEMAFAHVLDKKIFLLNPIPDMSYKDEIIAMQPIVIQKDFTKIR